MLRDLRDHLALGALMSLVGGCLIDGERCDAHQVEVKGLYAICVCEPNAVFNASGAGCTPCGDNEEVQNGVCTCKQGFVRPSADAACAQSPIGRACAADMPCSADYPFCTSDGYCTLSGCTSNAACPRGWTCESEGSTRYCRQPPSGLGVTCASNAECASFDAKYCETLFLKTCLLGGCAQGTPTCPNEWPCCDYSALLGSPLSFCASPDMLREGNCPMGGTRVSP